MPRILVEKLCKGEVGIGARKHSRKGFDVLPERWIVERTFAWLDKCRRLS